MMVLRRMSEIWDRREESSQDQALGSTVVGSGSSCRRDVHREKPQIHICGHMGLIMPPLRSCGVAEIDAGT